MADVEGMAVRDGADDLSEEEDGNFLAQAALHVDEGEQVTLVDIFKY
jgi:hypothetical protein